MILSLDYEYLMIWSVHVVVFHQNWHKSPQFQGILNFNEYLSEKNLVCNSPWNPMLLKKDKVIVYFQIT